MLILAGEALIVMLIVILSILVTNRNRQNQEMHLIDKFVTRFRREEDFKFQNLETVLQEACKMELEESAAVIAQISASEKLLLQHIIRMFLERDPAQLTKIEQLIKNLPESFCKLLLDSSSAKSALAEQHDNPDHEPAVKLVNLERVNYQLSMQLDAATQTINEILAEYNRIFSGHQTVLELENSQKKMLKIFDEAEQRVKNCLVQEN
jgi:HPt (histidine-containing phosphotransfer) domain-containing protein